jgi:hypothetical protein
MNTIIIVIGFIILVSAHQSSWLFVGGVSLIFGSLIAQEFKITRNEIELIIFSMTAGILGGLLVAYFKRVMIALAGFIAGGYICFYLPTALGWDTSWINWVFILLAATISAVIILLWGSLPLILISSLLGATVVAQYLQIGSVGPTGLFIVLSVFGLISQWILWHYGRPDFEQ